MLHVTLMARPSLPKRNTPNFTSTGCANSSDGRSERVNWEDSWLIETVDDKEWAALCETVNATYNHTLICLAEHGQWNESQIGMAIGLVTHTAYHLGAIRQMIKQL